MRKVEDLIHMAVSSLQFMARVVKLGWLCSLETKNMLRNCRWRLWLLKLVPMHLWFPPGMTEAYLSIWRTSWYLDKQIHSVYKPYKRNLFCEHFADMMQGPTSIAVALARKQNSAQASWPVSMSHIPKNHPPHHRHSQFCRSSHENSSSGIPITSYHLLNTYLNPCSCTQERWVVLSMTCCWDNVTQARENRWDLQAVKEAHKKKASRQHSAVKTRCWLYWGCKGLCHTPGTSRVSRGEGQHRAHGCCLWLQTQCMVLGPRWQQSPCWSCWWSEAPRPSPASLTGGFKARRETITQTKGEDRRKTFSLLCGS